MSHKKSLQTHIYGCQLSHLPPVLDEEMGKQRGEATMLKTHSRSSTRLTKAELDFMGEGGIGIGGGPLWEDGCYMLSSWLGKHSCGPQLPPGGQPALGRQGAELWVGTPPPSCLFI